jgi:hypothetical protein
MDAPKVDSSLREIQDFIRSESIESELIQQKSDKVKQEEQSLRARVFGDELIEFIPIENPLHRLGRIENLFDSSTV